MSPSLDIPGQIPAMWPEKPSFTRTCSLLSQYFKEKGRMNGSNNLMHQQTKTTMNLFPQQSGFSFPVSRGTAKREQQPQSAQMTIFYAGQVIVLNDFPEEKAKEIMKIAGEGKLRRNHSSPTNITVNCMVESSSGNAFPTFSKDPRHGSIQHGPSRPNDICHLPIARRASLHRFLEKRKERVTTRAPYQIGPHSAKSWLGLAAQSPE